jgi:hypothetical protein
VKIFVLEKIKEFTTKTRRTRRKQSFLIQSIGNSVLSATAPALLYLLRRAVVRAFVVKNAFSLI